jgi:hypothetical protein
LTVHRFPIAVLRANAIRCSPVILGVENCRCRLRQFLAWQRRAVDEVPAAGIPSGLLGCVNWRDLNHPAPTRFGIVANPTTQFAYLDHDHNWTRWPLPLL